MHHSISLNQTPTWCNKMQIYYCILSLHVSGVMLPSSGVQNTDTAATGTGSSVKYIIIITLTSWHRYVFCCSLHAFVYSVPCQYFILLMMGAWRPKHVEKFCSNKSASCCITSVFYLTDQYVAVFAERVDRTTANVSVMYFNFSLFFFRDRKEE